MKTKVNDEDDRIKRAVEEAEAKEAKDNAAREEKAMRMIQEASEHRMAMVRYRLWNLESARFSISLKSD